jgi:hypothetical protein
VPSKRRTRSTGRGGQSERLGLSLLRVQLGRLGRQLAGKGARERLERARPSLAHWRREAARADQLEQSIDNLARAVEEEDAFDSSSAVLDDNSPAKAPESDSSVLDSELSTSWEA